MAQFSQNFWNETNVLVTGGASFIGSHLVDKLVTLGSKVTVVDNLSSGTLENLENWKNLFDLVPLQFKKNKKFNRSGIAGIFSGSLELSKEGNLELKQDNLFEKIYIRKKS